MTLEDELEDLCSAEEFLDFFQLDYDAQVVHVNRLHILQRFHDYLAQAPLPDDDLLRREVFRQALERAYTDFVHSDARIERVFKVFRTQQPTVAFVGLDQISGRNGRQ